MRQSRFRCKRRLRATVGPLLLGIILASLLPLAESAEPAVDVNGTVHVPAFDLPFSSFASQEARQRFLRIVETLREVPAHADGNWFDRNLYPQVVAEQRERYAVKISSREIAGVYTEVFTPAEGIARANRNRILINLHGGGFMTGARIAGRVESIPIAATGRVKVISVDYRQGPQHRFPAASEDVAKVYKALLKDYRPQNIGIYGCSAGGVLTAQSVAWIIDKGLPVPGAIGMFFGTGLELRGDSAYFGNALFSGASPPAREFTFNQIAYFAGTDADNPLVSPMQYPKLLAKFPPSLLISATRAFDLSSMVTAQNRLTLAGVESNLHVWDGLGHCFIYFSDIEESREAYDIIVDFFRSHLGRSKPQ